MRPEVPTPTFLTSLLSLWGRGLIVAGVLMLFGSWLSQRDTIDRLRSEQARGCQIWGAP